MAIQIKDLAVSMHANLSSLDIVIEVPYRAIIFTFKDKSLPGSITIPKLRLASPQDDIAFVAIILLMYLRIHPKCG